MKNALQIGFGLFLILAPAWAQATGEAPWFEAARRGDLPAIKKLNKKIKVDQENAVGETALILSAASARKNVVDYLLSKKANLDHKDKAGNSALYYGIDSGADEIALELIHSGARVDDKFKDGDGLLAVAARSGRNKLVGEIVKRDASLINQANNLGETPVMVALRASHFSLATNMLAMGVKKDFKNHKGQGLKEVAIEVGVPEGHSFYKALSALD